MKLADATNNRPIQTIPMPSNEDFRTQYVETRKPVLLQDVATRHAFMSEWNLKFFGDRLNTIRVHAPDTQGVYHFLKYKRVPFGEFLENLDGDRSMYSLEPLIGRGAPQGSREDRRVDFDETSIPGFIPKGALRNSNLYIGPGSNKTLLHYDEVNSFLYMVEGEKNFVVFEPSETKYLYPYWVFDVRSILQNRVLDSKINPVEIDIEQYPKLRKANGWAGTMRAGEALFLPAGTWHYIESTDRNVAVNYFWHQMPKSAWLKRPLLDFWFRRRQVVILDHLRHARNWLRARRASA